MVVEDIIKNTNIAQHNSNRFDDVITESYPFFNTIATNISIIKDNSEHVLNETGQPSGSDISCKMFMLYFNLIVVGSFCIFGLTGNTLSLLVLRREQGNRTAVLLLQALAVVDNSLLLSAFLAVCIITGVLPLTAGISINRFYRAYALKYLNPLGYVAWTANIWITVLLAINR